MEEVLRHCENDVLAVLVANQHLPLELAFRRAELSLQQRVLHEFTHLAVAERHGAADILPIAAEIDAPYAGVRVVRHAALHGVGYPAPLTDGHVEAAGHVGAADNIVKQDEGYALLRSGGAAACAYQAVSLTGVLVHRARHGLIRARFTAGECAARGRHGEIAFGHAHYAGEGDVAHEEKHHLVRRVATAGEGTQFLGGERGEALLRAEYVTTDGVGGEEHLLEIVIYQFGGGVVVTAYLVKDDFHLLFHLAGGELRREEHIGKEFEGAGGVLHGECGVDEGLLLCGVCIELAADGLETADDMPAAAAGCALEEHVLHEMSHALLIGQLIASAGIDRHAAIGNRHPLRHMEQAEAVGECVCAVFHKHD